MRFCYFSENILSLKPYYQLFHFSVWLTIILFTISNILINSWNVHFHLASDWSKGAWLIWWLKRSIKSCKLNESFVTITNTSCVYLVTCVWVFYFLKVQKFHLLSTLALNYTKDTFLLKSWFYVWHSWNLHQRYFLKKMLFSYVISSDPCILHNLG